MATPAGLSMMSRRSPDSASARGHEEDLRSREDDVARQQRRASTQERYCLCHSKDQVPRLALLPHLAVDPRPDLQGPWPTARERTRSHDARPERGPAVKPLAQRPLAPATLDLPSPMAYVVAHGIAKDVRKSVRDGHVPRGLADDGHELALVVNAGGFLGDGGNGDRGSGSAQSGGWLVEEDWMLGDRGLGLQRRGLGALVTVGERKRKEGCPWRSIILQQHALHS